MKIKRSEARDILKEYLPEYMKMIGLKVNRGNPSPCCGGGRITKNSFHYNHKNNTVKCFSCGFTGDIFDLVRMEYGFKSFNEALEKTAELLGFEIINDREWENSFSGSSKQYVNHKTIEEIDLEADDIDYSEYIEKAFRNNDFKYWNCQYLCSV